MRILHIITSLDAGGAQMVLLNILGQLKARGLRQAVISLKVNGELAQPVRDLGVELYEIPFFTGVFFRQKSKVEAAMQAFQPDIIQSWMYHADFLTNFLNNPSHIPVVWGIHHTFENLNRNRLKALTKLIVSTNALFSRLTPARIICCSNSALHSHARIGFQSEKLVPIPNGIDAERFRPDPASRGRLREELGLQPETPLVGFIARFHPQKDHALFFSAARLAHKKNPGLHFVLAGDRVTADNPEIIKWMKASKYPTHFHLLGQRRDLPGITAGLDLATLTSSGDEAFPLTMIEAMACGIPCVATDVGDVRHMLGDDGLIVPPQNPQALAQAWLTMLAQPSAERSSLGLRLRARVMENFTIQAMSESYFSVYTQFSRS